MLYQRVHGDRSSSFHCFPHVAELLLDVPETLFLRPFPYLRLIKGGSIASVGPTGNPLIAVLWGLIMIGLLGSTSFFFSVSVLRTVVVLPFFLRLLHLSGEFFQVSQQTLVGETKRLHFVSIGLYSFESVSGRSAIQVTFLVLRPRGVGVTPSHVSSRYH